MSKKISSLKVSLPSGVTLVSVSDKESAVWFRVTSGTLLSWSFAGSLKHKEHA